MATPQAASVTGSVSCLTSVRYALGGHTTKVICVRASKVRVSKGHLCEGLQGQGQ